MKKFFSNLALLAMTISLCAACNSTPADSTPTPTTVQGTPTTEPTVAPTATTAPTPTEVPFDKNVTLLNTYGKTFGYMGTCVTYAQLSSVYTPKLIKQHYNSVTMENEMKPDAILGSSPTLLTVADAKALGYILPDNYTETSVPQLNFAVTDDVLRLCVEYSLSLRAHTLVWHSQTPSWFFREDYNPSGAFVTPEVMDARLEFYVRTVMSHIYENPNGHVVYAWDVVNEYPHATDSGWEAVYGQLGNTPSFVKLAYQVADDVLKQFEIRDKVSLFFNDYNTYQVAGKILAILNYVNAEEKLCDGIGMQAHLDTSYPPADSFKFTLKQFLDAGYEVQITELDVTTKDDNAQAVYYYNIMAGILELKKAGGNITCITYWGLSDTTSWRGSQTPLLFTMPSKPKAAYYQVIQAYVDAGYAIEK